MFCAPSLFGITLRVACVLLFLTCKEGLRGALQKSATAAHSFLLTASTSLTPQVKGAHHPTQTN